MGEGVLADACIYALEGGKRLRGAIVLDIANKLRPGLIEKVLPAAIAIESLHGASLVIDDLPCMDNDDTRRGKQSVHKKYGEAVAQLVSASLLSMGPRLLYQTTKHLFLNNMSTNPVETVDLCRIGFELMDNFMYNFGAKGACGGQLRDIFNHSSPKSELTVEQSRNIIQLKTGALIEIAFMCGYLYGNPSLEAQPQLREIATDFGLVFQIHDDICDLAEDEKTGRQNYVLSHGLDKAYEDLELALARFVVNTQKLGILSEFFVDILSLVIQKVNRAQSDRKVVLRWKCPENITSCNECPYYFSGRLCTRYHDKKLSF
jgi:geranylgeranyl pyrophosphate synthase